MNVYIDGGNIHQTKKTEHFGKLKNIFPMGNPEFKLEINILRYRLHRHIYRQKRKKKIRSKGRRRSLRIRICKC